MRLKPVPSPNSGVSLRGTQEAVPKVPAGTEDCCARLVALTEVQSADSARRWLTFMRALGLVEETTSGFVRTEQSPSESATATAFRERVYGAREVMETLYSADAPISADTVFDELSVVPRWEGHRDPNPEQTWRGRVADLLEWAVILGLAEKSAGGYRAVTPDRSQ